MIWVQKESDNTSNNGVFAQIVLNEESNDNNFPIVSNFEQTVKISQPKIISIQKSNNFLIIWRDDHSSKEKIYGRIINNDFTAFNEIFLISDLEEHESIGNINVASDTSGGFSVAWSAQINNNWQIFVKNFNHDGTPAGESKSLVVNNIFPFSNVELHIDDENKSVLAWEEIEGQQIKIYLNRYDDKNEIIGNKISVNKDSSSLSQINPNISFRYNKIYYAFEQSVPNSNDKIHVGIIDFNNPTRIFNDNINVPVKVSLLQNYPNPFNPATKIIFQLAETSNIELTIFNQLGENVATLIHGKLETGIYSIEFDANNYQLSSGIYFHQLKSEKFLITKKMNLVK